jgi:hypothetical protein
MSKICAKCKTEFEEEKYTYRKKGKKEKIHKKCINCYMKKRCFSCLEKKDELDEKGNCEECLHKKEKNKKEEQKEIKIEEIQKCGRCKREKGITEFMYNNKTYKTCFDCNQKRGTNKKNICNVCGIRAIYNFEGESIGIKCSKHKEPNMIDIKNKKCIVCKMTQPNFNFEGETEATHCGTCKLPNMVNVKSKKCIVCKEKQSAFNFEGKKVGTHCAKCKLPNMIDIKHKKCIVCKSKNPIFNFEGETKATHCGGCKESNMIDIRSKKCIVCKMTRPHFNFEGETKATHCGGCKEPNMINVKNKKCIVCKKTRPNFNFEGETKGTHCEKCKEPNMIDIKSKKCIVCKKTRPNFNFEGEIKATHCKTCKLPNMIDIKNKKCIVCKNKQPNFNFEGETEATHCGTCKLPNMVNVKSKKCIVCKKIQPSFNFEGELKATHCGTCKGPNMIDIRSKKCEKCNTRTSFGFPLNISTRCAKHKENGMLFRPNKKCISEHCKNKAQFGITNPIHCELHKTQEDIDLVQRICKKCKSLDTVNFEGLCINICLLNDPKYFPYRKNTHKKEERIRNILNGEFGEPYLTDKIVNVDCGRERPDIIYDFGTHFVDIEVDENQHRGYHKTNLTKCETDRMKNITYSLGMPVTFIRYNPDTYKMNGKKIEISKTKREDLLIKWIKKIKNDVPDEEGYCRAIYLFYDDKDCNNIQYENIEII